jgi:L-fuconolactonase
MIVDTHLHVLSPDAARYPRPGQGPSTQPKWPDFTGEMLIADLDRTGIERALTVQGYHTYHFDNSYAIDVALAFPQRLQSVVVIDHLQPDAPDLLTELVEKRGVRGLRMMKVRGRSYGEAQSMPLWERIRALKIPVCLNKVDALLIPELQSLLERFPEVPVALDHSWAGPLDSEDAPYDFFKPYAALARHPNLFLKIAPNLSHDIRERKGDAGRFWRMVVESFGADRLMWGSNYPAHWRAYGRIPERLALMQEELGFLGAENLRWIFGETALRLWPSLR